MRQLVTMLLLLALAGCSSTDWFHQQEPIKPAAPTTEVVPQQTTPRSNLSPAAGAAAPRSNREHRRTDGMRDAVVQNKLLSKSRSTNSGQNGARILRSRLSNFQRCPFMPPIASDARLDGHSEHRKTKQSRRAEWGYARRLRTWRLGQQGTAAQFNATSLRKCRKKTCALS